VVIRPASEGLGIRRIVFWIIALDSTYPLRLFQLNFPRAPRHITPVHSKRNARSMKSIVSHHPLRRSLAFVAAVGGCCAGCWLQAAGDSSITPKAVLNSMEHVADWQLANPAAHGPTDWTSAAGDAGFIALAGISGNPKYREAMLAAGENSQWQPGARMYHADDQCIGQTYTELYLLYREPRMIKPLRERFDAILAKPTAVQSLALGNPNATENWSWCDALFMGPPCWLRLYAATDDERYMNFAVTNWWRTADYLYDKEEHLFFRDSTYFEKKEANGRKVFWSRGNGWVMAGLARVLQYLPMNHPERPRFERMFREMAAKILACQQPDGLWRASLLDAGPIRKRKPAARAFTLTRWAGA
jgi:rhamnogalacturonyl hydrolase YesR